MASGSLLDPSLHHVDGRALDPLRHHVHTDARAARNGDHSISGYVDFRIDHVWRVVPAAGSHISRQGEVRQGREVNVVGPANTAFKHPTVPDRNVVTGG